MLITIPARTIIVIGAVQKEAKLPLSACNQSIGNTNALVTAALKNAAILVCLAS